MLGSKTGTEIAIFCSTNINLFMGSQATALAFFSVNRKKGKAKKKKSRQSPDTLLECREH